MNKSTAVVSDAEINSLCTALPNTVSFSASKYVYVIVIYAFGSEHEKLFMGRN